MPQLSYTVAELRDMSERWLAEREQDHAAGTVQVDKVKIGQFLNWLANK
jgi:hypothetical protein